MSKDDRTTHFGFRNIPIADKARNVARVFSSVADRYDVMNDLMSLGTHRLMKQIAVEYTAARPGQSILDLAGGTGDLTRKIASLVGKDGQVVLCDINDSMLSEGRDRLLDAGYVSNVRFIRADAESLPFDDGSFNAVTIGFGLRNFTDKEAAIAETERILAPGGRIVILEFSQPEHPLIGKLYDSYTSLWPKIGELVTGDRDSYRYLVESIKMHPPQEELRRMIEEAGFSRVRYHNLLNGVVAIHVGRKPVHDAPV